MRTLGSARSLKPEARSLNRVPTFRWARGDAVVTLGSKRGSAVGSCMTRVAAWLLAGTLACAGLLVPRAAHAQAPLTIAAADPDAATGTVTIAGAGFGQKPFVTLDLVPLSIRLAMDQRIVAQVPVEMIPPGTYLLTVSRGNGATDVASVDVRLGAPAAAPAPSTAPTTQAAAPTVAAPAAASANAVVAPNAAATVGDKVITLADVDREWQRTDPVGYLATARQQYAARRRIVSDLVNAELLSGEAARRGVSVDALLKDELPKRTVPMPDTAVTSLYQSLGTRSRGASIDQLRPALREWLARKVEPELARMTYLEELTKVSTRADILLEAPRVDVARVADDPALGIPVAPVELAMFGDFQSPVYARLAAAVPRMRELFGARVRVVFKQFPANDPASIAAAEAAACANLQGKFWAFHDGLLGEAGDLSVARFKQVAARIGLDQASFATCVDTEQTRDRIGQSLDEVGRYELPGPGSILVNGRLAPEPPAFLPPFEYLKRLVEEELAAQARGAR